MIRFFKRMSLMPKGLRYKMVIAFALMAVIPLLASTYLVATFIFPNIESPARVSVIVLLSAIIAFLGFVLAKKLIDPVIDLALETKMIANGDFRHKIDVDREDEIGELGSSINIMKKRIMDSMNELRDYSLKTKEVNFEIQKKVLALSGLLQIGDMIATSAELSGVLDMITEKACEIEEGVFTALHFAMNNHKDMKILKKGLSFYSWIKGLLP